MSTQAVGKRGRWGDVVLVWLWLVSVVGGGVVSFITAPLTLLVAVRASGHASPVILRTLWILCAVACLAPAIVVAFAVGLGNLA